MSNGYQHTNYYEDNYAGNRNQNSHHPKHTSHQQHYYNNKNPQYSDSPRSSQMRETNHSTTKYQPDHQNSPYYNLQNHYKYGYDQRVYQMPDNYHRYPPYSPYQRVDPTLDQSMVHQKGENKTQNSPYQNVTPYTPPYQLAVSSKRRIKKTVSFSPCTKAGPGSWVPWKRK
ncbi:unnamed protein product [Psylliodes chrysocephalus]|uniref:Uncharacterized protein n=1 Tax=Psylliodes chrysocephalus TaxID=3402493 RepID=A0A9P0CP18_9CUCU|nr:unnamed protein product [Psylliodes chrysocephala]